MYYEDIMALIPFYDENGQNMTRILLKDGTSSASTCSVKAYISQILSSLHLDPHALKFWIFKMTGDKHNTPLIISNDLIFIPIKFRKSIGSHDGCFGFINAISLTSAETYIENYHITLPSNICLNTLSTKAYIMGKQKTAQLLSYAYLSSKKEHEFMWRDHVPHLMH